MADEVVEQATGAETGGTGEVGTEPQAGGTSTPDVSSAGSADVQLPVTDSGEQSSPDEFADLYETIDPDPAGEAKPPVEPQAIPATITEALKTAGYADTPDTARRAVEDAAVIWQVVDGKQDAGDYLESIRGHYPERYQTMASEIVNQIKWATENGILDAAKLGITFGQPQTAAAEDPTVAALRSEVTQMKTAEQQRTEAAQKQQQEAVIAKTRESINGIFTEVSKGKWYEGDTDFADSILQRMDKNGVDAKLAQANLAEWRKSYERAAKELHNESLKKVADYSKRMLAHQQRLRAITPAAPGQKGGPVSGKAKTGTLDRASYPEGPDGLRQWQDAQMTANGWTS